jgi:hypothetical protein
MAGHLRLLRGRPDGPLAVVRPLTLAVLAEGAARALVYPLGYATVGLVLTLRRPTNPIGWLYAAAGLMWSLSIPGGHRPSRRGHQVGGAVRLPRAASAPQGWARAGRLVVVGTGWVKGR